jgi:WD40 repeat protein
VLDESDHTVTVAELSLPLPDPLVDLSFSPDGRWLAAGGYAGRLSVWDTADWSVVHEAVPLHSDRLLQVEWLPDSSTVVTSGADGRVVLYDAERGIVRGRPLSATADGHRGRAYVVPDLSNELVVLAGALPGRAYPLDPEQWFAHACTVAGRDANSPILLQASGSEKQSFGTVGTTSSPAMIWRLKSSSVGTMSAMCPPLVA